MKKFKAILLALVLLAVFGVSFSVEVFGGHSWVVSGDTVIYEGWGPLSTGGPAGKTRDEIKHIVIEQGITELYKGAASGFDNVTDISLPAGLTKIRESAFEKDYSLTSITIPEGVTEIQDYAFRNCTSLKSITLPKSLEKIEWNFALWGCTNLETIYCYRNTTAAKLRVYTGNAKRVYLDGPVLPVPEKAVEDSFDEKNAVQLTDYRYDNWARGSEGYNFFNVRRDRVDFSGDHRQIYNSVILKPDGTELFMQGKYSVNYNIPRINNNISHRVIFPQSRDYFLTVNRMGDKLHFYVLDKNGNTVADDTCDSSYDLGFTGYLDSTKDTAIIGNTYMDTIYQNHMINYAQALFRQSDKKIIPEHWNVYTEMLANKNSGLFCIRRELYPSQRGFERVYGGYTPSPAADVLLDSKGNAVGFEDKLQVPEYGEFIPFSDNIAYNYEETDIKNVDKSYVFKSKVIGGKNYYALFKVFDPGESSYHFIPTEKPSADKAEKLMKAYSEKLLYNNQMCRFKDNISRFDYAILATEAFCKAKGKTVEQYISENNIIPDYEEFTDTDNVYLLLAQKLGIIEPTGENTLSPERGMSGKEADQMLKKLASLMGVSYTIPTEWANQTVPFSREQTYAAVYDIYEKAKV